MQMEGSRDCVQAEAEGYIGATEEEGEGRLAGPESGSPALAHQAQGACVLGIGRQGG